MNIEIPDKVNEICVIAPSQELADNSRMVAKKLGYDNVSFFVGALNNGLEIAMKAKERGAEVFVSRKGTADLIEKIGDFQVVNIRTTMNDYLRHIHLLKEHKGTLGIVEYIKYIPELQKLCKYIELDNVNLYAYSNSSDYEIAAKKAINDNNTLLLGGGNKVPIYAKEAGIPHQIVENTQESIQFALEAAQQILALKKEEKRKRLEYSITSKRLEMIFNHTSDGMIFVNQDLYIQTINNAALMLIGRKEEECKGASISEILGTGKKMKSSGANEEILHIGESIISVETIPIDYTTSKVGTLYILRSIKDIQQREISVRRQIYKKGNTAKYHFVDIIGKSYNLRTTKEIAMHYAATDMTVLICGETGTGKELFAQSIHNASSRAGNPFVAINCATLSRDLLESQLFGYAEGAFTGASKGGRPGLFEIAHGGTLFLDEIGEIPRSTQAQLLRAIQEKEVRRIGSEYAIPVDVRVITATNRNLEQDVKEGRFRSDLYYRINILKLKIPPLRERENDARYIAENRLLSEMSKSESSHLLHLLDTCGFWSYSWPGNVRELLSYIERVSILPANKTLDPKTLFPEIYTDQDKHIDDKNDEGSIPYEKKIILAALEESHYNRSKAAEILAISRSTFYQLMKKYEI